MSNSYVAFLRGINVGGHIVKMASLRGLFVELGLTNVRTYIQSGNVFFESDQVDLHALASKIEVQLSAKLGFTVPVFVQSVLTLQKCIRRADLRGETVDANSRQLVMFLSNPLPKGLGLPHMSPTGEFEVIAVVHDIAFVRLYQRNGRSGNVTGYIEKKFGVRATGRFYHTLQKMLTTEKYKIWFKVSSGYSNLYNLSSIRHQSCDFG
jgi:uncharacterized protein (DUF1697 family)